MRIVKAVTKKKHNNNKLNIYHIRWRWIHPCHTHVTTISTLQLAFFSKVAKIKIQKQQQQQQQQLARKQQSERECAREKVKVKGKIAKCSQRSNTRVIVILLPHDFWHDTNTHTLIYIRIYIHCICISNKCSKLPLHFSCHTNIRTYIATNAHIYIQVCIFMCVFAKLHAKKFAYEFLDLPCRAMRFSA